MKVAKTISIIDREKTDSKIVVEAHLKQYDLHIIVSGQEIISMYDVNSTMISNYDDLSDVLFYSAESTVVREVNLGSGESLLIPPGVIHSVRNSGPGLVSKFVIKLEL
jgi:beta-galactosidase beta subunit